MRRRAVCLVRRRPLAHSGALHDAAQRTATSGSKTPGVRRRGVQAVSAVGGTGVITWYPVLFSSRTIFAKRLRWLLALTAGPVLHSELLGAKSSKWDDTGGRTNGRQGSSSGRAAIATRPCIG